MVQTPPPARGRVGGEGAAGDKRSGGGGSCQTPPPARGRVGGEGAAGDKRSGGGG